MKSFIIFITLFGFIFSHAQDPQLFNHSWRMEKIVTSTGNFTESDDSGYINYLNFDDFNDNISFIFGFYGHVSGYGLIFNDQNFTFTVSQLSVTFGEASGGEAFFRDNFAYLDFNAGTINNPFHYDFRFENGFIFLDITNNVGSVATFYDNFLSQDEFLKQNLAIYPNPVTDKLFIESPNMSLEQVNIYDLSGKMVFEQKDISIDNLDISLLRSGVYILKIKTPVGVVQRKLVKE